MNKTEYLTSTEETAQLVDMGSLETAQPDDVAGLIAEVEQLRQAAVEAEEELARITQAYDAEVSDHNETAKRAALAEAALVDFTVYWRDGTLGAPSRYAEIQKLANELEPRVKAGREYAAKHPAK